MIYCHEINSKSVAFLIKSGIEAHIIFDMNISTASATESFINIIIAVCLSFFFVSTLLAKEDATYSEVLAQSSVPFTQKHLYGTAPEQFYLRWQRAEDAP